ncbi:hypothetical protein T03_12166 [Trichinella britovi]|uniref:Uncharacterized protein n=1 Tax=Trichinella britovi TaxID=45882 RepID=A0A0V1D1A0_TRIBR|nr:hypothetical protein T03_12166 [Trichinella britovi]
MLLGQHEKYIAGLCRNDVLFTTSNEHFHSVIFRRKQGAQQIVKILSNFFALFRESGTVNDVMRSSSAPGISISSSRFPLTVTAEKFSRTDKNV